MKVFYFAMCIGLILCTNTVYSAEAGMPQLNPEFWIAQIFWLLLIFSSLYLIIWKIFLPKITSNIENRKSKIINDLNEAQKLKENAEKKLKEYNKIIESSKKDAKKIVEDGRKKLDHDIEIKKNKFNDDIEKELIVVEKEIKSLKKSSITNIEKISTEITTDVIKQIIDTDINQSSVSAIVKDVVNKKVHKYL
tara:strand:- start:163 stop:741 length:579 start_codon:yes stop_codon:yes gene_type:complete